VRGHGVFSGGADPVGTFACLSAVEHACRVQYLVNLKRSLDSMVRTPSIHSSV